jgi:hypothetical protein
MTAEEIAGIVTALNNHIAKINEAEHIRPTLHEYGYKRPWLFFNGARLRVQEWRQWQHDGMSRAGFLRNPLGLDAVQGGEWAA